jgi:CRISPR-associated protein Csm1
MENLYRNTTNKKIVLLAALLHDIGKVIQRKNMDKRRHQQIGAEFIKKFFKLENKDKIAEIIEKHHPERDKINLSDLDEKTLIVILADRLSSSEREEPDDEEHIPQDSKYFALVPIFERIYNEEKIYSKCKKLNPKVIENHNDIFPSNQIASNYEEVCETLEKNLKEIFEKENDLDKIVEKILSLYFKTLIFVPSATFWENKNGELEGSFPDISLYDHLKTTCAISCCLYNYYKNKEDIKEKLINIIKNLNKNTNDETMFSLIHGDLSGIQKFIYDIKTKKALKQLKGRSFLLDFLTEVYARYVVKKLNLCLANILFVGGGHFYIMSHKIKDKELDEISKEINEKLFDAFEGNIFLALGKKDLSIKELKDKISIVWDEVTKETSREKVRKFKDISYNKLFEPNTEKPKRCDYCGHLRKNVKKSEYDHDMNICEICNECIKLTNILKEFSKKQCIDIKKLEHIFNRFLPNGTELADLFKSNEYTDNLNSEKPILLYSTYVPSKEGETINISELAKESEGDKKIAILKMDVDNLGKVFKEGLGEIKTISRLSTLSTYLTLFFKYFVPEYVKDKYKDSIYLVYSGGDDTLIIGAWDKVIKLCCEIRDKFEKFVCENEHINLSAGIVITDYKHSFKNAVELAESELENAKNNISKDERLNMSKNSLSIFGYAFNWDLELKSNSCSGVKYTVLLDKTNKFIGYINKTNTRRLLHILKEVCLKLDKIFEKNFINIRYYHRLLYYLERNLKNNENVKKEILGEVERAFNRKMENNSKNLALIAVCARLAELKARGGQHDQ